MLQRPQLIKNNSQLKQQEQSTLQHRLFNAFTFIGFVLVLATLVFNSLSGLYYSALVSVAIAILFGTAYYQSTIKNRYLQSFVIMVICLDLLLAVNYFYNAGVAGPTLDINSFT